VVYDLHGLRKSALIMLGIAIVLHGLSQHTRGGRLADTGVL
jgi:hypothetical protein